VFASHAAVARAGAQHDEHMRNALQGQDVIGQAKGILMAQQNVSADEALDILKWASQRMNIKLRELAERAASRTPPDEQDAARSARSHGAGIPFAAPLLSGGHPLPPRRGHRSLVLLPGADRLDDWLIGSNLYTEPIVVAFGGNR
jgi:hypothetical protein